MSSEDNAIKDRDLQTLVEIVRRPLWHATPAPERIQRLLARGLIRKSRGGLRPTLKGRIVAWLFARS